MVAVVAEMDMRIVRLLVLIFMMALFVDMQLVRIEKKH